MTDAPQIDYHLIHDVDELRQAVALQRLVWGDDPEGLIPLHMLYSLMVNGSPIIGAFDGHLLVGVSVAFLGTDVQNTDRPALANLKLASKRLAVHPDYRDSGIGYGLKLEQRRFANQQGIRLITWTFDPLISRNAHLYIRRLGGVVQRYVPDFYHDILGQVDSIGSSDRFWCEWWVTSKRVEEKLFGNRPGLTLENYVSGEVPIVNRAQLESDDVVVPGSNLIATGTGSLLLVEIPPDYSMLLRDQQLHQAWREHTRQVLGQVFAAGYIVTDFVHQQYEGHERSFYVMGFDGRF